MNLGDRPDALAALGVLQNLEARELDADDIEKLLEDKDLIANLKDKFGVGTARLRLDPDRIGDVELDGEVTEALEEAWQEIRGRFAAPGNRGLRLELGGAPPERLVEIINTLESATDADSLVVVQRSKRGPQNWRWPLRIGLLVELESQPLRDALQAYGHQQLIDVVDMENRGDRCDLFLVPDPGRIEVATGRNFTAGFVVILIQEPTDHRAELADRVAEIIDTAAVAIVPQPDTLGYFLQQFLDELSHNHTPDIALSHANWERRGQLVLADPSFLDTARVTGSLAGVRAEIETAAAERRMDDNEFHVAFDELDELDRKLADIAFVSEGGGATATVEAADRLGPALRSIRESATEEPATGRFLQAQVYQFTNGSAVRRMKSFESGQAHEIRVRIGPSSLDWVQIEREFPENQLPRDERTHQLTVLLVAPGLFQDAMSETIELPRNGPTRNARFEVSVPAGLEEVEATILVYHRGTHLQTGYLRGPVTIGEGDPGATGIDFSHGQVSATDLDHGLDPELAFHKDGDQLVIRRPGHDDRAPSLAGIDRRFGKIRDELFKAAQGVYQLDSDLSSGPGLKLLRMLAAQGEFIRRQLFGDDPLEEVQRVQVVSPYSADFFPAEYLYDRHPPKADAELCPQFVTATGSDRECPDCPANDDGSIICPLGFWGLNRVIERQVRPKDLAGDPPPEPRVDQDLLPMVNGIVLAASNRVNDDNENEVSEMLTALGDITGNQAYLAHSWAQWRDLTEDNYPVLLVALPHNVENELGFQALQIDEDQDLAINEIGTDYRPPRESVILLLGCNTAAAEVDYEDFVAGLRSAGAAVVVGTTTYVLGMQAAPVAREFVRQFWSQTGSETQPIGEVLRSVRTRMVRDGNPLALAVAAYGDANWRLAPKGN